MFDDIDNLCNSHQEEQKSYLLGIEDAREDPDVKKQITDLGRENFTRGHNAGFACGLVIAALELYTNKEKNSSSEASQTSSTSSSTVLAECESILTECLSIVSKMKDLNEKKNDYQPETTYQKLDDDDDDEGEDQNSPSKNDDEADEEDEELRNSFRVILVGVIEKFIHFWKKNVTSSDGTLQFPLDQWEFLTSLVQDNKAGSPDNQTAISNLINDATSVVEKDDGSKKDSTKKNAVSPAVSSSATTTAATRRRPAVNKEKKKKTLDEVLDW